MSQEFQTIEEVNTYLRNKAVEDEAFRSRLLSDPKSVLSDELDVTIPDDFNIQVHEESASTAHIVIPPSSALSEQDLQAAAGGWTWCNQVV